MELNYFKLAWWFLKYRLLYPLFKSRSMYFSEPNVIYGLTDHPMDRNGAPVNDIFSLPRKLFSRTPRSVLNVYLLDKEKNSFLFRARAYNIFNRKLGVWHVEYNTGPDEKYTECALRIDLLTPDSYRLRLAQGRQVPAHNTPMISGDSLDNGYDEDIGTGLKNRRKSDFEAIYADEDDRYVISTESLTLHVYKESFRVEVFDAVGDLVARTGSRSHNEFPNANDAFPLGFVENRLPKKRLAVENFDLFPGEAIFGLGEYFGPLNRVGQTVSLWHLDATGNSSPRSYKSIPFFMSSRGYGVFFNDYAPMTFWVGSREVSKIQVAVENDLVDYYFFYGPEPKKVLGSYTALTGRAQVAPRWTLGTWMSRLSYGSQEEVLEVARRLRHEKIPTDVLNLDTNWSTVEWACDWSFDGKRFPDPALMFQELDKMGFKLCLWQIPYVMNTLDISREGKERRAFAKNRGPFIFVFLGLARVIDFSREEGIRWYREKLKRLFSLGARAVKVDFGEQIEPHQRFLRYSGRQMHNLYPLLYNKAAFEASQDFFGTKEAVIWARSAYAGSQRYPVHWSGDNSSNYANMPASLRGGLSLGLCGFTYWSQDVGGFVGLPDDTLYIRWATLSIFQSHIRFHGCPPLFREPWNFSQQTQETVRKILELRYRLIPYIFSESIASAHVGIPLMRTLFFEFPDDPNTLHIDDQFMCGETLLVAPILTESDTRRLYLPAGYWHDFWTGDLREGGRWYEDTAPPGKIPLYVRGGRFLPMGEVAQYIPFGREALPKKLTLYASPNDDPELSCTLHDEAGSIRFEGVMNRDRLDVEVQYEPKGRESIKVEVELPPGYDHVVIDVN
ncbi:MAG: DUF4968 domain-containing protein [Deltaproteobacteria bacterium]|nr:DUF4968 domain-containing protein [Candidatus Zymogenaceae bacterium]